MVVKTILNKFKVVELAENPASFVICSKTRLTIDITSKENLSIQESNSLHYSGNVLETELRIEKLGCGCVLTPHHLRLCPDFPVIP